MRDDLYRSATFLESAMMRRADWQTFEQWLVDTLGGLPEAHTVFEKALDKDSHSEDDARMEATSPPPDLPPIDATGGILIHYTSEDLPHASYIFRPSQGREYVHCSAFRDFVWSYGSGKTRPLHISLSGMLSRGRSLSFDRYKDTNYMCVKFEDDIHFKGGWHPPNPLVLRAPFMENGILYRWDESHKMKPEIEDVGPSQIQVENAALWKDGHLVYQEFVWMDVITEDVKRKRIPLNIPKGEPAGRELREMFTKGTFTTTDHVRLIQEHHGIVSSMTIDEYIKIDGNSDSDDILLQIRVSASSSDGADLIKVTDPKIPHRHHFINSGQCVRSMRTRCVFLLPNGFSNKRLHKGGLMASDRPVAPLHVVITDLHNLVLTKVSMKGTPPLPPDPTLFCGETLVFQMSEKS